MGLRNIVAAVVAAIGAAGAVSGCGTSAPHEVIYVRLRPEGAYLFQWHQTAPGHGVGVWASSFIGLTPPYEEVFSTTGPLTVTIQGNMVTLVESETQTGVTAHFRHTGTLAGGKLTIQQIGGDGQYQNQVFTETSEARRYNSKVRSLYLLAHTNDALARQRQKQKAAAAAKAAEAKLAAAKAAAQQIANAGYQADQNAKSLCLDAGGSWEGPGTQTVTISGYSFTVTANPSGADCTNIPYLGTDDAQYYVTGYFTSSGAPIPVTGAGSATQSECDSGYYPDQSAGNDYQTPGIWAGPWQLCLVPSG